MEFPQGADLANPSASVGLTAVNGSASTAMRSDAAPALDQSISPVWTGRHNFSDGDAATPSVYWGSATGFWHTTGNLNLSISGVQVANITGTVFTWFGTQTTGATLRVVGDGGVAQSLTQRQSDDSNDGVFILRKSRGSFLSLTNVQLNDFLGQFSFQGYRGGSGSGYTVGSRLRSQCIETGTISSTAFGTRLTVEACPIGSGTLSEIARLEALTGLSMFGANPVIDANRVFRRRVFTVGTLPTGADGMAAFVSDANATTFASDVASGGSNHVPVYYSSGTSTWKIG